MTTIVRDDYIMITISKFYLEFVGFEGDSIEDLWM